MVVQAWTSLPVHSSRIAASTSSSSRNKHIEQQKPFRRQVFGDSGSVPSVVLLSSSSFSHDNAAIHNNTAISSGLVEARYYYEDVDEEDVDEDSVLASILQDQRQQQQLGENNKEDQSTRNGRPKTPLLKSFTNATDDKQQVIKNRRHETISHSQSNNQQQQQQPKWPTNKTKQPPTPPKKATIMPQKQQTNNNPAKLSTSSFVAKNSDKEEDNQLASASTKGADIDRAFTTNNSNSNHDGNQQVPVVRLQATNNTDTILLQGETVGSGMDSETVGSDVDSKADTNTWEKSIHETSTNDTGLAWEQHDNKNIDPAVSSLMLNRPTSLSSTIINPYRNTTVLANIKNSKSTGATMPLLNARVTSMDTGSTASISSLSNDTAAARNDTDKIIASVAGTSTSSLAIRNSNATLVEDINTNKPVVATPDTTPTVNTVSPANKNKTITATLITTTTPVISKSTNGMTTTNVNMETTGTAVAANILPHVSESTTKTQSSTFNERLAIKSSSIWSKLGIPSKRPVNNKMVSIQNSEEASSSNNAVLDDKSTSDTKYTVKKKKITFWSSLVQDLHTAPTIVVPENASWSANSIRDTTSSALKYTRGSEVRRKDR